MAVALFSFFSGEIFAQISKRKNIAYADEHATYFNDERHRLDIYFPKDTTQTKNVFVFFHGGSWRSGKKNTYRFLAKRLAKKGYVAVLVNYRLSPEVKFDAMGEDCARSILWVQKQIHRYGGDPTKIVATGHSAGGHLAAYISLGESFKKLDAKNPIWKSILIDPFGLDMFSYFNEYDNKYSRSLKEIFTDNPSTWKKASPLYYIESGEKIPFLVLTGSKTYPTIKESSEKFTAALNEKGGVCTHKVIKGKKHIGMITQLIRRKNRMYSDMAHFIDPAK